MADFDIRDLSSGGAISDADLFISRQGADVEDVSVTGGQFKTYMGAAFIELDGTSVTTDSIPFAQGITIPNLKKISFDTSLIDDPYIAYDQGIPYLAVFGGNSNLSGVNGGAVLLQGGQGLDSAGGYIEITAGDGKGANGGEVFITSGAVSGPIGGESTGHITIQTAVATGGVGQGGIFLDANTGIINILSDTLVDTDKQIQFRDSTAYINSPSAGELRLGAGDFGYFTLDTLNLGDDFPRLTPQSSGGQYIGIMTGGLYVLADPVNTDTYLFLANQDASFSGYFHYGNNSGDAGSYQKLLYGGSPMVINRDEGGDFWLRGQLASAPNSRGGRILWQHGGASSYSDEGYTYVNIDGDIVFDDNEQSSSTDKGNAYINMATGQVAGKMGTSTSFAKMGGSIFDHFTDVGNVGTGDDTLYSDTIPANALATNGDKIQACYGLTLVNSTSTKRARVKFAGTTIFDSGALTLSASGAMVINLEIIRVSSSVIRYSVTANATGASTATFATVGELTGLTLSNTNALALTGETAGAGTADNDIVAKMGTVKWFPVA